MKVDEFILELTLKADQFTRATSDAVNSIDKAKDAVVKSSEKIEEAIRKAADGANDSSASIAKALDEISKHTKETAEQTKKFNEEAEKSHKNTANAAKGGTEQLSKMAREALALFGIFTTAQGVKGFVQDITESDAALGRFATNLGVAPQAVSAWGTAVGRMGGSAEATQASVQGLYDKLWRMQQLGEEMPKEYWLLGSHGHVELDRTKDIYSQILDLAKAVQNIDRTDGRTNAVQWGRFAGLNVDMINVILAHKNDLKEYLADQEKLGPTAEQVAKFQKLQDAWETLSQKAISVGRSITSNMTPAIVGLSDAIGGLLGKWDAWLQKDQGQHGTGIAYNFFRWAMGVKDGEAQSTNASVAGQPASSGTSGVTGNSKAAMMTYAMDQLRKEGVPETHLSAAAAELVGEAIAESGLDPAKVHDHGTGYGIYGARDAGPGSMRRSAMLAWLAENGYPMNSAEGQMRYMAHEAMTGNYPRTRAALMRAGTGTLATDQYAITKEFENPAIVNDRSRGIFDAYRSQWPSAAGGSIFANPAAYQGYSGAGLSAMMNQTSNVSNSSAETHFNGPIHVTLPNVTNAKEFAGGLQAATVDWGSANFNQGVQ